MARAVGLFCVIGLLISGCAAQPPSATVALESERNAALIARVDALEAKISANSSQTAAPPQKEKAWIDITPLSKLEWDVPTEANGRYSDAYTRLVITSETSGHCKDCKSSGTYPYESREWLARFFVGTHHTVNLTAKVTMGTFSATVPLVTIDHVSNRTDGEGFSRVVYHQAEQFPLFLVKGDGSNGILSAQFLVKGSDQYQSGVAATALQAAQQITASVAPQAKVLTTLTAQSNKDLAAALDKTVSQLFGTKVAEEHWIDKDATLWGTGASVTFNVPRSEGDWDGNADYKAVGTWNLTFGNPRPSIFSDAQICPLSEPQPTSEAPTRCFPSFVVAKHYAETMSGKKPEDVLNYQLIGNTQSVGTIAAYLKQIDWWQRDLKAFPSNSAPKAGDVASFCRSIRDAIAALQLNYVDQGIVAVAVREAAQLPPDTISAMSKNTTDCGFAPDPEDGK